MPVRDTTHSKTDQERRKSRVNRKKDLTETTKEPEMITESMKLTTLRDAMIWANNFGVNDDESVIRLGEWIWKNKPFVNCVLADHPISELTDEDFWNIAEGDGNEPQGN